MKVQVKVTEVPEGHVAYARVESALDGNPSGKPVQMRVDCVEELHIPDTDHDVRVFLLTDKDHAKTVEYLRTGSVEA